MYKRSQGGLKLKKCDALKNVKHEERIMETEKIGFLCTPLFRHGKRRYL